MKYSVPSDLSLLEALILLFPTSSKNTLRSWIKAGRVEVDRVVATHASLKVSKNQFITIGQRKKMIGPGIPIVYEDRHYIVVDKPTGLLSVASSFEKGETMHALLKEFYYPRKVHVVHRLDQDTSGIMLFAFNQEASEKLKDLFEVHAIDRAYTGIIEGRLSPPSGTWKSYQYEDAQYKVHETEDESKGRLAITHYRTLDSTKRYSLLELRLETGRKNQIRVHCQSAGHSIVGDKKYGAQTNPLKRLFLHAHLLAFEDPFNKKFMRFESPIPVEFNQLMLKK